jgi:hypothetical protein
MGKSELRTLLYVNQNWYNGIKDKWWNETRKKWYQKLIPNKPKKIVAENMLTMEHYKNSCNLMDDNLLVMLSTFTIHTYGKVGIINVDFKDNPEIYKNMKKLLDEKKKEYMDKYNFKPLKKDFIKIYDSVYEITRQKLINDYNKCLSSIIKKAKDEKVDMVFMGGSFNYKFTLGKKFQDIPRILEMMSYQYSHITRILLSRYDEIAKQFELHNIEKMNEGVDNMGPSFPPTCVLNETRDEECKQEANWSRNNPSNIRNKLFNKSCYLFDTNGTNSHGKLGWCDRIFFNSYSKIELSCILYTSSDFGSFAYNNHRAVFGLYELNIPAVL